MILSNGEKKVLMTKTAFALKTIYVNYRFMLRLKLKYVWA